MKKNRLLFLFGILLCYSTLIGKNGAEVERIKSLISEAKALKSTNIEVFISFVSFKLKVLKYKNNNILAYLGNVSN